MKRVLAAAGILLLIIGISVYTLVDMQRSIDKISGDTAAVRTLAEREGAAAVRQSCEQLMEEWNGMEPRFCSMSATITWIISWSIFRSCRPTARRTTVRDCSAPWMPPCG